MSFLSAEGISKTFDNIPALRGISIRLRKGEWMAVLGESGSGKSTLLRIIGRFIQQDQGTVRLGREVFRPVQDQLIPGSEKIRLVHQEFDLFPNQTVQENIAYPLRFHPREFRDERTGELLEIIQLAHAAGQKAKLLSGGEKQRTAIAKAIADVPEVLLMDEPFSHLDLPNRNRLSAVLTRLRHKEKLTCIFVTHDASDAFAWADQVLVLKEGRLVQEGTPRDLYQAPADAYVAELTGHVNWIVPGRERFVRPERTHVTRSALRSKWTGKVVSVFYRGRDWEYTAENKGTGSLFRFFRTNNRIRIGEEVHLTYPEREIIRLSRRETGVKG